MKKTLKLIALILCITLILSSIPLIAHASEKPGDTNNEDLGTSNINYVCELSDKRTSNTKTFLMSDRSETVAVYETPVHYKENGKWEDVDNSFYSVDDESIENSKNIFKTKFAKESGENRLVEITKDSFSLKWNLIDCNRTTADYTEKSEEETENISILKNVVGSVLYKDILHDTDIYYDVSSGGLKESIVLKSADSPNEFRFTYESDDLDAAEEDGSIIFKNPEGEKVFEFEKFYMFDSDLAESDNIEVEINEIENGVLLTIKPDEEWINSDERKWPIVIDPGIIGTQNATDVWDIDLKLNQTSAFNYKAADFLVGSNGSSTVYRSLVRFVNLPDLGSNSRIVSAKMNITAYQGPIKSGDPSLRTRPTDSINVCVHKMTANWPEQGAMWSTYGNSYSSEVEDYFTYNNTSDGFVADITQAVTEWYQNPASNYGVILKAETETASNHIMQFTSSDYGTNGSNAATWRPVLGVNYRNTTGIEDYWSYSTYSADEFGTSYVNNANGNMIYEYTDYEYTAEVNSFSIKHIYNSSESNNAMGRYGKGWRLNLVQRFEPVSGTTANYVYTDGDGTKHYFSQAEGSSKIIDEDGLGYEYTSISEGELIYKLTAKDGSIMKFDQWGFLRKSIDSNGNTINLYYSPSNEPGNNVLTGIGTKSGNNVEDMLITLAYDANYILKLIKKFGDSDTDALVVYNYENSSLRHPEKADGTGPYFWFTGKVSAVRYGDEQKIGYTYDSQNRISNVTMQDNASNTKESIGYAYKYNITTLTDNVVTLPDNTHRQMTYEFDTFGRPVCVFDNQGNTAYCDYSTVSTNIAQIYKNNKAMLTGSSSNYINNLFANGYLFFGTNGYTTYDYSEGAGSITSVTGEGLVTSSSLKINITPSQTTGRTLIVAQAPSTTQGKTYTYSAYIKTNNITPDDPSNSHHGALLKVTTNQNNQYFSDALTGTTDSEVDNGYEKISVTFTIGASEYITTASAGIFNANGEMYIDCLQFEENETANHINIINNSGFERLSGSVPTSFGYTANAGITTSTASQSGSRSVSIPGSTTANKTVYQTISQNGIAGDVYTFGAWAKANSVPNTNGHASFRAYLHFTYTDNTTEDMIADFNPNVNDWQFVTKTVKAAKNYSQIVLYMNYHKNCGQALFDSVFLYRDTAQAYSYDSNGNIVATTDAAKQDSSFQYTGNNLSKMINPTGTSFIYSYDSKNNIVLARSSCGLQYNINYDGSGNPLSTSASADSYSFMVQPNKQYYIRQKSNGKYLTAATGSSGGNVSQNTFSGADTQKWEFEKVEGKYYYIKSVVSPNNNLVLGVSGGSNLDDANIVTQARSDADYKKFDLILKNDGSYKLRPKSSGDNKIVTVNTSNDDVRLYHYVGDSNEKQQWFIEEVQTTALQISEGVYCFRNRNSGKYLDTRTSASTLTQYHRSSSDIQKFRLHEVVENNTTVYKIESVSNPGSYLQIINNGTDMYNIAVTEGSSGTEKSFSFTVTGEKCKIFGAGNRCLAVGFSSLSEGAQVVGVGDGTNATRYWIPERLEDEIKTSATYSNNGQRLTSSTDSRGKTTGYTYLFDGKISTVTDPRNVTTTYTYDQGSNRVSSVSSGNTSVAYSYGVTNGVTNNKMLSGITSPSGTVYNFAYDTAARVHSISVGGSTLSTNTYDSAGRLSSMTYGNGASVGYTYDGLDRVTQKLYNNVVKFEYTYDKLGNLVRHNNLVNNTTTKYAYDLIGRILNVKSSNGTSLFYKYDQYNRTNFIKYIVGSKAVSLNYMFGTSTGENADFIYGIKQNGTDILSYSYDKLARLNSRTLNTTTGFTSNYTYLAGANAGSTTTLIESINNGGNTLSYTYDDVGNITEIKKNNVVYESYEYDGLNQLTKVTRGNNVYTYSYDGGGNITEVKLNGNTVKSYTYGDTSWKDLLTRYNNTDITYDSIGNPLTYRDGFSFTWSNGRQLTGVTHGTDSISYQYDDNGLRTQKTVNNVTTEYYRLNGVLLGQKTGSEYIIYLYDENGAAYGLLLKNGTTEEYYYYIYNAQGDVIGIIDESGTQVVEYDYDAWGKVLSITGTGAQTIGEKNPIRYRGYYYDTETGFYYLQSRYYDPETGRFLNADGELSTGTDVLGCNLFAYCGNNPVICVDPEGYGKTYVFYYNDLYSGFKDQAMNSPYYNKNSKNVVMIAVKTVEDFKNAWKSMNGTIDYIYLYLHGGTGVLYFKGETMYASQIKALKSKKVKYRVYLFSCHGGDGKEGKNVAWAFSKLTSTSVIACTGSVSYSRILGKYYARKAWDFGIIKTFYYEKKYVIWGKVVAKSAGGQW